MGPNTSSWNNWKRTGKGIPSYWLLYAYVILLAISSATSEKIKIKLPKFKPAVEPGNYLGVFTERITLMQSWLGEATILKEWSRKYLTDASMTFFREVCEKGHYYIEPPHQLRIHVYFGNCSFTPDTVSGYEFTGSLFLQLLAYNNTMKQVRIKEFTPTYDDTIKCVVENVKRPKFYASVSSRSMLGMVSYDMLDTTQEDLLKTFGNKVQREHVLDYSYPHWERFIRFPTYECILSLMTSATVEDIEDNCKISCLTKKDDKPVKYRRNISDFREEL